MTRSEFAAQLLVGGAIGFLCVFLVAACGSWASERKQPSPWVDGRAQRAAQDARHLMQVYTELDRTARFLIEGNAATLGPRNVAEMRDIVGRLLTDYQHVHGQLIAELLLIGQWPKPEAKKD